MQNKIEELKIVASDKTLSTELRKAAQRQLEQMGKPQPEPEQSNNARLSPTEDFIQFRLRPIWERLLVEPKSGFERWLASADARERIRRHDEAATRQLEEVAPRYAALLDCEQTAVIANLHWHSWDWTHPRTADGKSLWYLRPEEFALLGQGC